MAISIKKLINMSRHKLSKMAPSTLKQAYNTLKKEVSKRVGVYTKHNMKHNIPKNIANMDGVDELDNADLVNKIGEMSNFMLSKKASFTSWMENEKELMHDIEDDLDIKFKSFGEYEEYKRFLNDMYARDKKGWRANSEQYEDAIDLWLNARRLNLKGSQFLRNRDYWLEHVDDLKNAKPIKRGTKLYPSDYAKQLKLPKIKK